MQTVSSGQVLKQSGIEGLSGQHGISSAVVEVDVSDAAAAAGIGAIQGAPIIPSRASTVRVRRRIVQNRMAANVSLPRPFEKSPRSSVGLAGDYV
jgi:hypothetical protein